MLNSTEIGEIKEKKLRKLENGSRNSIMSNRVSAKKKKNKFKRGAITEINRKIFSMSFQIERTIWMSNSLNEITSTPRHTIVEFENPE